VKANPNNYDAWFDYLRLVESEGDLEVIRETYERAIANVPPTKVSELMLFSSYANSVEVVKW
jgi:crooked neck